MSPLLAFTLTAAIAAPGPAPSRPAPLLTQAVATVVAPAATAGARPTRSAAFVPPGGDSLKNGAIAGAITGGLAMGGFVGFLCYALDETEGSGDCIKAAALWTGIGAAGGAALGAGVDALFTRGHGARRGATLVPAGPSARVRIRF